MAALIEGPYGATVDRVVLEVDGNPVDAVHARPDGVALAAVALMPDIGGLRPLFDDLCRRLATHGLAVCAVEPFDRIPTEERTRLDVAERMERVRDLVDDHVIASLGEAADHLAAADGVHAASVMGFCMGGYYTLKAAATGRFERAVSFYGMVRTPENWMGPGHGDPLATAAASCPTLYLAGDLDPWASHDDVAALRTAWRYRDDCRVLIYRGADHGFVHDAERPAHRAGDAADAWRHALAWVFEGVG